MKKIASFIVKYRILFVILFAALMVFSIFSMNWVNLEDDFATYLPEGTEVKTAIGIMEDEFTTYATADIMVEDVSLKEAKKISESIEEIDGVSMVVFDETEDHYKENAALYNITFDGTAEDESAINGYADVQDLLSDYTYYVTTDAFSREDEILVEEMSVILIIIIIVVIAVLILTSSSFLEPLVLLITFLAAALINMGTNFLLGTISFVSNAVAIVLQLALSVDYAIIYSNRYKEAHQDLPVKEAAKEALSASIPEIFASSLTTIAGLLAMCFMQFQLGQDLGFCLIKAILLSLLSVFLLMPALLVWLGPLMDKTKHKNFVPKISFLGRFAYKTRFIFPIVFVALVIFAYISFGKINYAYDMYMIKSAHQNVEELAAEKIEGRFGKNNMIAVIFPSGDMEKEAAFADDLLACDEVNSVLSLSTIEVKNGYTLSDTITWSEFAELAEVDYTTAKALFAYYAAEMCEPEVVQENLDTYEVSVLDLFLSLHELAESGNVELEQEDLDLINELYTQLQMAYDQLQGENYSRMLVYVDLDWQSDETFAFLDTIHVIAAKYYPENVYLAGDSPVALGFATTFQNDIKIVGFLSVIMVMLILLFTFKSFGMPLLLILIIQGSIWINFAISVWTNVYVYFMCYLIVSAIQMGANIDYAIVISSRYTQLRNEGQIPKNAIVDTLNFAFPTVITSGSMMVISGLLIGQKVSTCVIAGMGKYIGTGTLITLVLVNLVLPQLLVLGDSFIRVTTIKFRPHPGLKKLGRQIVSLVLAAAVIFALVVSFIQFGKIKNTESDVTYTAEQMLQTAQELMPLAEDVDCDASTTLSYKFAESLLTDIIGSEELAEGEAQYYEGLDEYNAGKAELTDGERQYQEGLKEYNEGKALLVAGKEKYDEGLARITDAKAQYADGEKQLAQARIDYAAGEQELADAKVLYAEGEAQLAEITPIYNIVYPLYEDYQEALAEYNQALAEGDYITAALLWPKVTAAKALFEAEISSVGYSLEQIIQEYQAGQQKLAEGAAQIAEGERMLAEAKVEIDDGQRQLDEAAIQIAEGEKELAEGKAELDAGYAQLKDAEKQLADARSQLDDGQKELEAGGKELESAEQELEEGKAYLANNKKELEKSLEALDAKSNDVEKLDAGTQLLQSFPGVNKLLGSHNGYTDTCNAAIKFFTNQIEEIKTEASGARLKVLLLIFAALLGAAAFVLTYLKHAKLSRVMAFVCTLSALICALIWNNKGSFGNLTFIAALALGIIAVIFLIIMPTGKPKVALEEACEEPYKELSDENSEEPNKALSDENYGDAYQDSDREPYEDSDLDYYDGTDEKPEKKSLKDSAKSLLNSFKKH